MVIAQLIMQSAAIGILDMFGPQHVSAAAIYTYLSRPLLGYECSHTWDAYHNDSMAALRPWLVHGEFRSVAYNTAYVTKLACKAAKTIVATAKVVSIAKGNTGGIHGDSSPAQIVMIFVKSHAINTLVYHEIR